MFVPYTKINFDTRYTGYKGYFIPTHIFYQGIACNCSDEELFEYGFPVKWTKLV